MSDPRKRAKIANRLAPLSRLRLDSTALGWSAFCLFSLWFAWRLIQTWAMSLRLEDQLIVLRYARNLVEGNGLVYNLGERVMGFTTPLFTLLSSVFVAFGGELAPNWQNAFGVFCLLGTAGLAARLLVRIGSGASAPLAVVLLTWDTASIPRYPFLGMEIHLFTLLFLLAVDLHLSRRSVAAAATSGALFLTRPEGALLSAMLLTQDWISTRKVPVRQAIAAMAVALPWLAFALFYFGSVTTATLEAKQGVGSASDYVQHVANSYVQAARDLLGTFTSWSPLVDNAWLLLAGTAATGAVLLLRRAPELWPLLTFPLATLLGYAALGVWPGFKWHYYPLSVLAPVLLSIGVHATLLSGARLVAKLVLRPGIPRSLARFAPFTDRNLAYAAKAALVALALPPLLATKGTLDEPRQLSAREQSLADLGKYLANHYDPNVRVMVDELGYIGWFSRLHLIDSQGLITPDLKWNTPRVEALDRHVPDLVLVPADGRYVIRDLVPWMYRSIDVSDLAPEHRLYSRIDHGLRYETTPLRDALLRHRSERPGVQPERLPITRGPDEPEGYLNETLQLPYPGGSSDKKTFQFIGWAVDPEDPYGLEDVVFLLGGNVLGSVSVDLPRQPGIAAHYGRGFEYSGFALRAKADQERLEREGVLAFAVSTKGTATRLRFHYLRLERGRGGVEILPTSDGRRLPVRTPNGDLQGSIEFISKPRERTRIGGWAADVARGEGPRQIVIYRDGRFLTNLGANRERLDLAERLEDPDLLRTGFQGPVPGAPDPATFAESHRVFALMLRGVAVELPMTATAVQAP